MDASQYKDYILTLLFVKYVTDKAKSDRNSLIEVPKGAEGDDLLGDASKYLMRHFATETGRSKGQFYTPAEVSRVLAKVVGIGPHTRQDQTVYDPTCGSGSLLLKVAAEATRGISIYGREKDTPHGVIEDERDRTWQ